VGVLGVCWWFFCTQLAQASVSIRLPTNPKMAPSNARSPKPNSPMLVRRRTELTSKRAAKRLRRVRPPWMKVALIVGQQGNQKRREEREEKAFLG
jgi:hypothetical protein